jgi:hypothetical protein
MPTSTHGGLILYQARSGAPSPTNALVALSARPPNPVWPFLLLAVCPSGNCGVAVVMRCELGYLQYLGFRTCANLGRAIVMLRHKNGLA